MSKRSFDIDGRSGSAASLSADETARPTGPTAEHRQGEAAAWGNQHPVNIRVSIPLGFARCYLTVVGGIERRSPQRRADERQRHPLIKTGNVIFASTVGIILGLALLYLIQLLSLKVWQHSGIIAIPQ